MPLPNTSLTQTASISVPTVYYCDPGDIQRRLSIAGVQLRTQDYNISGNSAEAGVIEDVIWDATETINFYCDAIYQPQNMVQSFWVNRRCVDIAVYLLELRRGNIPSGSVAATYKQAIDWLERIHSSQIEIPGIPVRHTLAPAWSNISIDQRYPIHRIRVERSISDNSSAPYGQSVDWQAEYDYCC